MMVHALNLRCCDSLLRPMLALVAIAVPLACAAADPHPVRSLRIVSFPPGTSTDILARTFALLGAAQPFLKSGQLKAIATTGTERVAALNHELVRVAQE